jgi:hypothetical protein
MLDKILKNTTLPGYTNAVPRYSYWIQQNKSRTKHNNPGFILFLDTVRGCIKTDPGYIQMQNTNTSIRTYENFWFLDKVPGYSST